MVFRDFCGWTNGGCGPVFPSVRQLIHYALSCRANKNSKKIRMKIVHRYLITEVVQNFLATVLILTVILASNRMLGYLAEVVEGKLAGDILLSIMGLKLLWGMVIILPISAFFAALLALGRWYRDNEMTALLTAGFGQRQVVLPLAGLSLFAAALVAYVSLSLGPWSSEKSLQLREQAEAELDLMASGEGHFREFSNHTRVFYADKISEDETRLTRVFAQTRDGDEVGIIAAKEASWEMLNGNQYLVMSQGFQYQGVVGQADFSVTKFDDYALLYEEPVVAKKWRHFESIPTLTLLKSDGLGDVAELQWRIAAPISVLLLMMLAIPLSVSGPREGSYGKLAVGLIVYLLYFNLLSVSKSWVVDGKLSPDIGLWWVHLAMIVVIVWQIWRTSSFGRG